MSQLIVIPESYLFEAHEEIELRRMLIEIDRHTIVTPVGSSNGDLTLNEEGHTSTGFTYSNIALAQLCALIAPGLAQLVLDLTGQWRKPGEDRRLYSMELAREVLNRCIRLRFDRRLAGLQLVRNTKTKVIDGIVGAKYRYNDFFDRISKVCPTRHAKFHEACLYGRHLVARYINQRTDSGQYVLAGEPYTFGYHFANSEIGGKSVRASSLIVRCETGECALTPFNGVSGGRVVHSGRDFEKRLHELFDQIIRTLPDVTDLESCGIRLEDKNLGLGTDDHERRVRYLVQILTRRKLTQDIARRVVASAASIGSDKNDSLVDQLPSDQRAVLTTRTAYDLFVALIREARKLPIDQREIAEQVAHVLLTNKAWLSE